MTTLEYDAQTSEALAVAREMAEVGVPLFTAEADPTGIGTGKCGFWLPTSWEQTRADPAVVDRWRPGMALCGVMGHGLDLLDVDPRNGGELSVLNGSTPASYGVVLTPSGGVHSYIASLGVGSRDNIVAGIDVKGGAADGSGRGFAFLPPTVRISKTTGELAAYRWAQLPDLGRLRAVLAGEEVDGSGAALAARIRALKADSGVRKVGGPDWYREFLTSREPQSAPAAERAIRGKLEEVVSWTAGSGVGFRQVLLRAALTLGGYVGGGYLDEVEAREKLAAAATEVWGGVDDNDLLWIDQGITDGQEQPFAVYTAADELAFAESARTGEAPGGTDNGPPWTVYTAISTSPFDPQGGTDQEMAEQVLERMYPALRYAADAETWLIRGAHIWRERDDLSGWATSSLARLMPLGDPKLPAKKGDYTEENWTAVRRARLMNAGTAGPIERKMRALLRGGDHPASIELAHLDTDPEVLWAGGLPWDLRTSRETPTLAEIDPATPHLHNAFVAPDQRPTPHWDQFVAVVWPDAELRAWALRVLSITLAGYPDAALPVLYGPERTGKTSLIQLIVRVLGSYGHAADPRLLAGADNAHASVVYALKGRRLSFIDEGPRRGHLASERLKQLTGGGSLTGNAMRANPVTFEPTHTLVMTTNDEPPITDPALRARMRIIPCEANQAVVRAARRAITPAVWRVEAPGVLAALMAECAAWLDNQDTAATAAAPLTVRASVEEMVADQDSIQEWVEACTVHWSEGTPLADLFKMYAAWHDLQIPLRRVPLPTKIGFARTLSRLGFENFYGGPRGKTRMRALTVMGGAGGPLPTPPSGQASAATVPQVAADQTITSAAPQNRSSDPIFSSVAADAADTYSPIEDISTHTPKRSNVKKIQDKGGPISAAGSAPPSNTGVPPATMRCRTNGAADAGQVDLAGVDHEEPHNSDIPAESDSSSPSVVESEGLFPEPKKITNADVAARAYQGEPTKQITKAEARALLKAEERQAAIDAAAGEVLELPAVVDRAQNVLPVNLEQAAAVVRSGMITSGALTVDVETSGYPVGHELYALRSVQLGNAPAAVVLHPVDHAETIRALLAEAPKLHAHSASADLVPLAHAGLIDAAAGWAKMHDTVIPAKLADPRSTGSDPGLKQLSGAVLGASSVAPTADAGRDALWKAARWQTGKQRFTNQLLTPLERNGWAQVQTGCTTMLRYAASDVLDTAALAQVLPAVPEPILGRERLAEAMTARVAHRGLRIDAERVAELSAEHTRLQAEAGARVRTFGIENPGSGPQIAAALAQLGETLPVSEKGNASVAEHVLSVIKRSRPDTDAGALATAVLDYRHSTTVLGLFLAPYTALCERADGRMRPTVYTLGTDTGRMSAVRPNVQQLPREGGVRSVITADPGYMLISADFSGVELRGAAALSQDPTMMHMIAEEDAGRFDGFHWAVARQAFGPDATKSDRYVAKRGVFGKIYGGGVSTLAKQVGVTEHEMGAIVASLDALTPGLSQWSETIRRAVRQGHTQFPSYSGRVIHFPRDYPHKAPNYCVGMDTPVLRSDLTHVPASKIQVGDRLVAFDEYPQPADLGGQNKYHHLRTAVVEATSTVIKPSVRVRTADGKVTECSTDHWWLARPLKGRANNRPRVRWVRADELRPGDDLLSLGTWDVAESRTAGYLAGLYDGEGCLARHAGGRRKNQLFFSQVRGPVMDAMQVGMDELGLPYSYYNRPPNSTTPTDSIVVSGLRNVLRTLGTLQPARFRPRFETLYEGNAITAGLTESVPVTAIEPAGRLELASIQTSTRTLIANGYLSHNCIQGSCRELLVDALVRWRDTKWGDCTLIPVHDELIVMVPEGDADEATRTLVQCMAGELYGVQIVADPSEPTFAWADSS